MQLYTGERKNLTIIIKHFISAQRLQFYYGLSGDFIQLHSGAKNYFLFKNSQSQIISVSKSYFPRLGVSSKYLRISVSQSRSASDFLDKKMSSARVCATLEFLKLGRFVNFRFLKKKTIQSDMVSITLLNSCIIFDRFQIPVFSNSNLFLKHLTFHSSCSLKERRI